MHGKAAEVGKSRLKFQTESAVHLACKRHSGFFELSCLRFEPELDAETCDLFQQREFKVIYCQELVLPDCTLEFKIGQCFHLNVTVFQYFAVIFASNPYLPDSYLDLNSYHYSSCEHAVLTCIAIQLVPAETGELTLNFI